MKKSFVLASTYLTLALILGFLSISGGCSKNRQEGFAIYLTRDDVPPASLPVLSHIEIEDQPFIAISDIETYNSQTHEIKLTSAAFERISQLAVPVQGRSFAVCVNKQTIYSGAFWTPVSSLSFSGVTIWKPYSFREPYVITLELAYPAPSFYQGEDPRNDPKVLKSLEQVGKLVKSLTLTSVKKLPQSMKGYEIYSWTEGSQWKFALLTGTNRNKTNEEIISGEDFISEAGWVNVRVSGIEALKTILGKLPPGEDVFWLARPRSEMSPPDSVLFAFPPQADIENVREFSLQRGLKLVVANVVATPLPSQQ